MQFSNKQIWQIAYPILISLMMEHIIGLTDTAFLGRVGEVELGASALAGVYYATLFMLGFGFSIGSQIMMARRNGEQHYKDIGAIFSQAVLFLTGLAAVMFIVSKIWSPILLRHLIGSDEVYAATMKYLDWRIYSLFFAFIALIFRSFFVATTNTRILTINSIVMVLSNVVLNYALIFGKFGLPQMGIAGAAIASSVAELVSVIFYVIYTRKKVDWRKYGMFRFVGIDSGLLKRMLNISVWTMIQSFIAVGTWFIFFLAVEHLGERPLATTNLVRSISMMLFMMVNAFASTTSSLVSNLMGAEKTSDVMPLCWKCIRLCYAIVMPVVLVIALFPSTVLRVYTDNIDLIDASVPALWVMLSAYILNVPAFILFNAISGTGNTRSAMVVEFVTLTFYMLYVFYVVIHQRSDVAICWTSEHIYGGILLALAYLYMKKANWQARRI